MSRIASIIVNNKARNVSREFSYLIPPELESIINIGMRVIVPFGSGNKLTEGYVINLDQETDIPLDRLKSIIDIADNDRFFDEEMLRLVYFLKDKYFSTLGEAFKTIFPSGVQMKESLYIKLRKDTEEKINPKYQHILDALREDRAIEYKTLIKLLGKLVKRAVLFSLHNQGFIEVQKRVKQNVNIKTVEALVPQDMDKCLEFIGNHSARVKKQAEILDKIILAGFPMTRADICSEFGCSTGVVRALEEKGYLTVQLKELYRTPYDKDYIYNRVKLTQDQENALKSIEESYGRGRNITLIHGVTGCGKTEIYLNLIEKYIDKGLGAIMLVPEISLTPQTVERFKGRFGDVVAVIHSKLSEGERYDEWRRIKRGEVKVVVGARSAVFAPVKDLKVIIIDEEHEYSYKSETSPRYATREVAEYRIGYNSGLLVMGSATPSIESYFKAKKGEYNLIEITKRIDDRNLPEVKVIDMRNELKNGNKSMFSRELFASMSQNLENKGQTILFLNRRGYSTFISCRKCGYVSSCTHCDVSLTYHIATNKLSCHYCGEEYSIPKTCPECGSDYIRYFGAGTEKLESEVKKYFNTARVLRMDLDTTRRKGEHERIYNEFKEHRADILIGTQIITKGMDFKDVTLVGVISADMSLNLPDFRASERTFQLITQVSGRAGRGEKEGKVIVQSYDPENYSIAYASKHDYTGFYNHEIEVRRALNNPPFSDILYIMLASSDENELIKYSIQFKKMFREFNSMKDVSILGPSPCHISKIKNNFRWHVIFKGEVKKYYKYIYEKVSESLSGCNVSYSFDINPYSML